MDSIRFVNGEKLRIMKGGARRWYGYIHGYRTLLRSQLVMMNFLHTNRIPKKFDVHHKDENTENDAIENLELLSRKQHNELHHQGKGKYGISKVGNIATYNKIRKEDPEVKFRDAESHKRSYEKHKNNPDSIAKQKLQQKIYIFNKRKSDPVFREQQLEYTRAWRKRKKEESNALS